MRIMGLDVGSKTVGVAISDPLGFTAQGVEIIKIDEEAGEFGFDRLGQLSSCGGEPVLRREDKRALSATC